MADIYALLEFCCCFGISMFWVVQFYQEILVKKLNSFFSLGLLDSIQ